MQPLATEDELGHHTRAGAFDGTDPRRLSGSAQELIPPYCRKRLGLRAEIVPVSAPGRQPSPARNGLNGMREGRTFMEHAELKIYLGIFRASPDFISFCRMDGTYIDVNPAFERFVGLPRENIIGRTALQIGLWPDAEQRSAFVAELKAKGELLGYRKRLLRANGEARDVEGWAHLLDTGDEPTLVAIGRDVTEQTRDAQELVQYRDRLEQLVEQRTAELSKANKRLQVANEAKSAFLACMSHELRTPLNAILGYAQILTSEKHLSPLQSKGLNIIQQGGEHLLALINDLLDLSKIEAGKLELAHHKVDLNEFLKRVGDTVRVKVEQKGLRFRYDVNLDMPCTVMLDEQRVRQVLLNLLGNAIKFTDVGHVALRVTSRLQSDGHRSVYFEVSDTGAGIRHEHLERIFQPFEQVGDQRLHSSGTGLGLPISRQLVRMMESEIHVVSERAKGSRFSFELIVAAVDTPAPPPPARRRVTGYQGGPKKILVVDDVSANRTMLTDLLHRLEFSVMQAADGQQALLEAMSSSPHLILMDIRMPLMSGAEATRRIRRHPDLASIPIIAMSASASPEDKEDCMAAGANAFVTKPIDQEHLLQLMGTFLGVQWNVEQEPSDGRPPMVEPVLRRGSNAAVDDAPENHGRQPGAEEASAAHLASFGQHGHVDEL